MTLQMKNGVAVVSDDTVLLTDVQAMLDLIATVQYEYDCDKIAIYKEAVAEDFFRLSTGLAGALLQKVVNYRKKLAIIGDFSQYTSKALRDFIYESNQGNSVFFVATEEEAIIRLTQAP